MNNFPVLFVFCMYWCVLLSLCTFANYDITTCCAVSHNTPIHLSIYVLVTINNGKVTDVNNAKAARETGRAYQCT